MPRRTVHRPCALRNACWRGSNRMRTPYERAWSPRRASCTIQDDVCATTRRKRGANACRNVASTWTQDVALTSHPVRLLHAIVAGGAKRGCTPTKEAHLSMPFGRRRKELALGHLQMRSVQRSSFRAARDVGRRTSAPRHATIHARVSSLPLPLLPSHETRRSSRCTCTSPCRVRRRSCSLALPLPPHPCPFGTDIPDIRGRRRRWLARRSPLDDDDDQERSGLRRR